MKTRQELIDDCRHAVQGVWLDLCFRRRHGATEGELSLAIQAAMAKTDEYVSRAIAAAVEIVKAQAAAKPPTPGVKK